MSDKNEKVLGSHDDLCRDEVPAIAYSGRNVKNSSGLTKTNFEGLDVITSLSKQKQSYTMQALIVGQAPENGNAAGAISSSI